MIEFLRQNMAGFEFVVRNCRAEDAAARYVKLFRELAFADSSGSNLIRDAKESSEQRKLSRMYERHRVSSER